MIRLALYAREAEDRDRLGYYANEMAAGSSTPFCSEYYDNPVCLAWDIEGGGEYDAVIIYRDWNAAKKLRCQCENVNIVMISPSGDRRLYDIQPCYVLYEPVRQWSFEQVVKSAIAPEQRKYAFAFRSEGIRYRVDVRDIMYLRSAGRRVDVVCRRGSHSFYGSIGEQGEKLESMYRGFAVIHKSYIVNLDYALKLECGRMVMADGTALEISDRRRAEITDRYMVWKNISAGIAL